MTPKGKGKKEKRREEQTSEQPEIRTKVEIDTLIEDGWISAEVLGTAFKVGQEAQNPEPEENERQSNNNGDGTISGRKEILALDEPCPQCNGFDRRIYEGDYGTEVGCAECGLYETYFNSVFGVQLVLKKVVEALEDMLAIFGFVISGPEGNLVHPAKGITWALTGNRFVKKTLEQAAKMVVLGRSILGE